MLILILLLLAVSLAIFSLFVAVGTIVIKKIWFKNKFHIVKEKERHREQTQTHNQSYRGNPSNNTQWYPTGWTYNEETQLWEPPDYVKKESDQKWDWDQKKRIWIDKEKAARNERYRKAHEGQPPTFEEWKAAREAEQKQDSTNT